MIPLHLEQATTSRAIADATSEIIYQTDPSGTIVWVSAAVTDALGWLPEELIGLPAFDFLHPADRSAASERRARIYETGAALQPTPTAEAPSIRLRNRAGNYRWFRSRIRSALDSAGKVIGVVVSARDTHDEFRARKAYETLTAANRDLVRATNEGELLDRTCQSIVQIGRFDGAWFGRPTDATRNHLQVLAAAYAGQHPIPPQILDIYPIPRGPVRDALDYEQPILEQHLAPTGAVWSDFALGHEVRSRLALPVRAGGRVDGVLCVYGSDPDEFDQVAQALLIDLTDDLGYGIARLRDQNDLVTAWTSSIDMLAATVEFRDPYTAGHQAHVAALSERLGHVLALDANRLAGARLAAYIHDLGKVAIPLEVLGTPGALTDEQRALLQTHPDVGWQIASRYPWPWPIAEIIRQHHERMDGSGYPRGLQGDEIMIESRIVAVADVYDAVRNRRAYRPAQGRERALEIIEEGRGTLFDDDVVTALLVLLDSGFDIGESDGG